MPTLIDATNMPPRSWNETAAGTLTRILASPAAETVSGLYLVHRNVQQPLLELAPSATSIPVDDTATPEQVAILIRERVANILAAGSGPIAVYTFWRAVREQLEVLGVQYPGRIRTVYVAAPGIAARRYHWDETHMPATEALQLLQSILSRQPGFQMYKASLRPALATVDPRFSLSSGSWAAEGHVIGSLVSLGEEHDLIETIGSNPASVRIRLKSGPTAAITTPEAPVPDQQPVDVPPTRAGESTSARFITTLREAGMGPFLSVRLAVYTEIDRVLETERLPLRELIASAVRAVRDSGLEDPETFPWSRVRSFIELLMSKTAVAISESGERFRFTWQQSGTVVAGLEEGWQLMLDGELILALLGAGEPLDLRDVPDLAGALFNGRDDDKLDRVFQAVERLQIAGKIDYQDGTRLTLPEALT
jgi:hypothetical protein